MTGLVDVDSGQLHSIALRPDGTMIAWGMNDNYQIGQLWPLMTRKGK